MDREQGRIDHHPRRRLIAGPHRCPVRQVLVHLNPRRLLGNLAGSILGIQRPLAVLLMVGQLAAAGCAALGYQHEELERRPDGVIVEKVTGSTPAEDPPAPGDLSEQAIVDSLRRITVRYHGIMSFVTSDPEPLLSDAQATQFAEIVHRQLPELSPKQWVRFQFRDVKKNCLNDMDVYRDGNYLVYRFSVLVGNTDVSPGLDGNLRADATAHELPGQIVHSSFPRAMFKDPVTGDKVPKKVRANEILAAIRAARTQGTLPEEDVARLQALTEQRPEITFQSLQVYLDKRATLKKAHDQGLMDEPAYRAQQERLERELAP